MKHYYSFLIITSLLLTGCGQKDRAKSQFESSVQTEDSYPLAKEYIKEAVITGKVLNRDFYPQEKELTLIIPFFWKMENQYRTPIQEDGSFSFRFPVYAKLREVSIRNYAEHLSPKKFTPTAFAALSRVLAYFMGSPPADANIIDTGVTDIRLSLIHISSVSL